MLPVEIVSLSSNAESEGCVGASVLALFAALREAEKKTNGSATLWAIGVGRTTAASET